MGKAALGRGRAVEQHEGMGMRMRMGMRSPFAPPPMGALGGSRWSHRAQRRGLTVPRFLGRSLPRSLCLGFPTCGNKYLPVKPSQLLPS